MRFFCSGAADLFVCLTAGLISFLRICRWLRVVIGQFVAHGFDFRLHGDVFLFLAREVVAGELQLGAETFRGEQVGVFEFVFCAQEVAGLDVAFFQQRFDQVVGLAQTDAQDFGKPALADFGFRLDDFENTELGLFGGAHGLRSGFERNGTGVLLRFQGSVIASLRGWGWIAALRSQ